MWRRYSAWLVVAIWVAVAWVRLMPVTSPIEAASTTTTLSTGGDHWLALTSTGSTLKWYIDGALIETMTFSMQRFRGVSLTEEFGLNQGSVAAMTPTLDVKQSRIWARVLSLSELTAEAASSSPILTSDLLSNVGLAGTGDLADTVGPSDFTALGTPATDGSYVQFNSYNDHLSRSAAFVDLSRPFSWVFHLKLSAGSPDPTSVFDTHILGPDGLGFAAPYVWVGNLTPGALDFYVLVYLGGSTTAPQLPLDTSSQCCGSSAGGHSAGDILPYVDPAWTASCVGDGIVPTDADISTSEDWSA